MNDYKKIRKELIKERRKLLLNKIGNTLAYTITPGIFASVLYLFYSSAMESTIKEGGHFIKEYDSLTFTDNSNPNIVTEYIDPEMVEPLMNKIVSYGLWEESDSNYNYQRKVTTFTIDVNDNLDLSENFINNDLSTIIKYIDDNIVEVYEYTNDLSNVDVNEGTYFKAYLYSYDENEVEERLYKYSDIENIMNNIMIIGLSSSILIAFKFLFNEQKNLNKSRKEYKHNIKLKENELQRIKSSVNQK